MKKDTPPSTPNQKGDKTIKPGQTLENGHGLPGTDDYVPSFTDERGPFKGYNFTGGPSRKIRPPLPGAREDRNSPPVQKKD